MHYSSNVEKSKVKVTRPLNAVTLKSAISWERGEACRSPLQRAGHIVAAALQAAQLVIVYR